MVEKLVNQIFNVTNHSHNIAEILIGLESQSTMESDTYFDDDIKVNVNKSIDRISSIAIVPKVTIELDETKIDSLHQFKDSLSNAKLAGNVNWLCIIASKDRNDFADVIYLIPKDNLVPHLLMLSREHLINYQTESWIRNIYNIQAAA